MDVLFGDVDPSGKLVYNIAKNESDYNGAIWASYTTFAYGNLALTDSSFNASAYVNGLIAEGGSADL
ncbi:hypothetical protein E8E12_009807 [Didymella heteroderae]|uniref:Uncharacterized protein n=1 Tax=Didymella heteroderae TaxID=1769908 RepID=A0A9P4WV86_9PLEO|nr:hypothetical protein E8E12_009807 [Didymella heteroderae]